VSHIEPALDNGELLSGGPQRGMRVHRGARRSRSFGRHVLGFRAATAICRLNSASTRRPLSLC